MRLAGASIPWKGQRFVCSSYEQDMQGQKMGSTGIGTELIYYSCTSTASPCLYNNNSNYYYYYYNYY